LLHCNFLCVCTHVRALVPILSQIHPVHTFLSYFPKTHCNIFPSMFRPFEWSLPVRFSDQNFEWLIFPMCATCPVHFIPVDLIILIICGEAYRFWSSSLYSLFQPPTSSSLLGPNIFLSTVHRCPQYLFFPWWERPSFTLTQNERYNYNFVYFNLLSV